MRTSSTIRVSGLGVVLAFGIEARVSAERDPPTVRFIDILRTVYHTLPDAQFR